MMNTDPRPTMDDLAAAADREFAAQKRMTEAVQPQDGLPPLDPTNPLMANAYDTPTIITMYVLNGRTAEGFASQRLALVLRSEHDTRRYVWSKEQAAELGAGLLEATAAMASSSIVIADAASPRPTTF